MEGTEGDGEGDPNAHTDAALAFFGIAIERQPLPGLPCFYLWPENLEPFRFFLSIGTQWRVGVNGATGLDYQVVRSEIAVKVGSSCRHQVAQRRNRLFSLVQAMEAGALEGWKQRAQEERDARPPPGAS
nr:DUF1799 domain-containing protein [uncultured Albidiferax sp.]